MKVRELANELNKLCEQGKGNCDVACRTFSIEEGCDKFFDNDIELKFENDIAIIDFDRSCFEDVLK